MAQLAQVVVAFPAELDEESLLEWARHAVRGLERYSYRRWSCAVRPDDVREAEHLNRTIVGLRRKLDNLKPLKEKREDGSL